MCRPPPLGLIILDMAFLCPTNIIFLTNSFGLLYLTAFHYLHVYHFTRAVLGPLPGRNASVILGLISVESDGILRQVDNHVLAGVCLRRIVGFFDDCDPGLRCIAGAVDVLHC
jgi:hypothetical protein